MSTTFAMTFEPTPFGFYDSDADFASEADAMVLFVKRKLGDDVLSVELTKKQIWCCFEHATNEFGRYINEYKTKSELASLIGKSSGSFSTGSSGNAHKLPKESLQFLMRQAEAYSTWAGLGGSYDSILGKLSLTASIQDYNIYTDLKNDQGVPVFDLLSGSQKTKMRILEVMHFGPQAAFRFFDSTSAINYLNNEFSFESFTPETIFYVLPVFEDILRAQQMDLSQRVRRSNYSYRIIGRHIRIFPMPVGTQGFPKNLYIRVMPEPDPFDPAFQDESINGISNLSNVPYGNLEYSKINSIGRQWIRDYTLACAMEILGHVYSKFKGKIPVPGSDAELPGAELLTQAREDKEKLRTDLKELLESLTYSKLLAQEAEKSDNLLKQLSRIPVPNGKAIIIG